MSTPNKLKPEAVVGCCDLFADASGSMFINKAIQLAVDFCKYESWGLDFWRQPMALLAVEVERLRAAIDEEHRESERRRKDILRWVHRYERLKREMENVKNQAREPHASNATTAP